MKKVKTEREYSVPALDKAFNLLNVLISADKPLSLSQLAKMLNEQPSGIFRILNAMSKRGYINRDNDSGLYSISLLGKSVSPLEHLKLVSTPIIESYMRKMPCSCHLSILSGFNQLVVYNALSQIILIQLTVLSGRLIHASETNTGMLMISRLPEKKRERFFKSLKLVPKKEKVLCKNIEQYSQERTIKTQSLVSDDVFDVISIGPPNSKGLIWAISCPLIRKTVDAETINTKIFGDAEAMVNSISEKFN